MTRKARVRSAFADWYPVLADGDWHDAKWLMESVLRQLRRGSPRWNPAGRVLDDRHFEFEGGELSPLIGHDRRTKQAGVA